MKKGAYRDEAILTLRMVGVDILWQRVVHGDGHRFLAQVHDGDTIYAEAEYSLASNRGSKARYCVKTYALDPSAPLKTSKVSWHSDPEKALAALTRAGIAAFEPFSEARGREALSLGRRG